MTNLTYDEMKALTSIADGTLTESKERYSTPDGPIQALWKKGLITGAHQPALNYFVLVEITITHAGWREARSTLTAS